MSTKIQIFILLLLLSAGSYAQQANIQGKDTATTRNPVTSAVPFLAITPDARSGGMGDIGVAISPDANGAYWNPAKMAFIDQSMGFAISYTPWLGKIVNDMNLAYLSGFYKITREQTISASFRYFDLGDIQFTDNFGEELNLFRPREYAVSVNYSRLLSETLSLGLTGRFLVSNLTGDFTTSAGETNPAVGAAADIGIYYHTDLFLGGREHELTLGGVISNIGPKITYTDENNRDFIPTNFRVGAAWKTYLDPYNSFTFGVDVNKLMVPTPPVYQLDSTGQIIFDAAGNPQVAEGKDPNRGLINGMFGSFNDAPGGFSEELKEFTVSAGVEYWYNEAFAARFGYFHEHEDKGNRKYFTFGLGFRYQVFGLDFAYLVARQQEHPLAETLRFTLIFNFEDRQQEETITD